MQLTVFFVDEVGPANRFSPLALERGMIKEWKKIFEVDLLFRNFWAWVNLGQNRLVCLVVIDPRRYRVIRCYHQDKYSDCHDVYEWNGSFSTLEHLVEHLISSKKQKIYNWIANQEYYKVILTVFSHFSISDHFHHWLHTHLSTNIQSDLFRRFLPLYKEISIFDVSEIIILKEILYLKKHYLNSKHLNSFTKYHNSSLFHITLITFLSPNFIIPNKFYNSHLIQITHHNNFNQWVDLQVKSAMAIGSFNKNKKPKLYKNTIKASKEHGLWLVTLSNAILSC